MTESGSRALQNDGAERRCSAAFNPPRSAWRCTSRLAHAGAGFDVLDG
jgi:hypothetical protein